MQVAMGAPLAMAAVLLGQFGRCSEDDLDSSMIWMLRDAANTTLVVEGVLAKFCTTGVRSQELTLRETRSIGVQIVPAEITFASHSGCTGEDIGQRLLVFMGSAPEGHRADRIRRFSENAWLELSRLWNSCLAGPTKPNSADLSRLDERPPEEFCRSLELPCKVFYEAGDPGVPVSPSMRIVRSLPSPSGAMAVVDLSDNLRTESYVVFQPETCLPLSVSLAPYYIDGRLGGRPHHVHSPLWLDRSALAFLSGPDPSVVYVLYPWRRTGEMVYMQDEVKVLHVEDGELFAVFANGKREAVQLAASDRLP